MEHDNNTTGSKGAGISRRDFLSGTATTAAAFTIILRYVLGGSGYTAGKMSTEQLQ